MDISIIGNIFNNKLLVNQTNPANDDTDGKCYNETKKASRENPGCLKYKSIIILERKNLQHQSSRQTNFESGVDFPIVLVSFRDQEVAKLENYLTEDTDTNLLFESLDSILNENTGTKLFTVSADRCKGCTRSIHCTYYLQNIMINVNVFT